MRTLHLFSGAGGGLLADRILGHTPIAAVEWDAYCCAVLRERAAEGWFPGLRVIEGDIRDFDPSEYAGRVDCVSGGFPCQDISAAGKGAGLAGERSGLWAEFARVIGVVRPRYAFIENSPMLTLRGLDVVLCDLAALGFDAEWAVISAADAGAPHLRERIWILANARGGRLGRPGEGQAEFARGAEVVGSGEDVANADLQRRQEQRICIADGAQLGGAELPSGRLSQSRLGRMADGLADSLDAPADWLEEPENLPRVAQGIPHRVHRLKAIGNGQVPQAAALAWRVLFGMQ